jgi:hypothetical protein
LLIVEDLTVTVKCTTAVSVLEFMSSSFLYINTFTYCEKIIIIAKTKVEVGQIILLFYLYAC